MVTLNVGGQEFDAASLIEYSFQHNNLSNVLQAIVEQLKSVETTNESLVTSVDTLKQSNDELKQNNNNLQSQLETIKSEFQELKSDHEKTENQVQENQTETNHLKNQLANTNKALESMKLQLEESLNISLPQQPLVSQETANPKTATEAADVTKEIGPQYQKPQSPTDDVSKTTANADAKPNSVTEDSTADMKHLSENKNPAESQSPAKLLEEVQMTSSTDRDSTVPANVNDASRAPVEKPVTTQNPTVAAQETAPAPSTSISDVKSGAAKEVSPGIGSEGLQKLEQRLEERLEQKLEKQLEQRCQVLEDKASSNTKHIESIDDQVNVSLPKLSQQLVESHTSTTEQYNAITNLQNLVKTLFEKADDIEKTIAKLHGDEALPEKRPEPEKIKFEQMTRPIETPPSPVRQVSRKIDTSGYDQKLDEVDSRFQSLEDELRILQSNMTEMKSSFDHKLSSVKVTDTRVVETEIRYVDSTGAGTSHGQNLPGTQMVAQHFSEPQKAATRLNYQNTTQVDAQLHGVRNVDAPVNIQVNNQVQNQMHDAANHQMDNKVHQVPPDQVLGSISDHQETGQVALEVVRDQVDQPLQQTSNFPVNHVEDVGQFQKTIESKQQSAIGQTMTPAYQPTVPPRASDTVSTPMDQGQVTSAPVASRPTASSGVRVGGSCSSPAQNVNTAVSQELTGKLNKLSHMFEKLQQDVTKNEEAVQSVLMAVSQQSKQSKLSDLHAVKPTNSEEFSDILTSYKKWILQNSDDITELRKAYSVVSDLLHKLKVPSGAETKGQHKASDGSLPSLATASSMSNKYGKSLVEVIDDLSHEINKKANRTEIRNKVGRKEIQNLLNATSDLWMGPSETAYFSGKPLEFWKCMSCDRPTNLNRNVENQFLPPALPVTVPARPGTNRTYASRYANVGGYITQTGNGVHTYATRSSQWNASNENFKTARLPKILQAQQSNMTSASTGTDASNMPVHESTVKTTVVIP